MKKTINEIYSVSPYKKGYKNNTKFNIKTEGSDVYGEVTQEGTDNLVKRFYGSFDENCVFYDLGSGIGKMVLHIGMQYKIKKSIGIELSKERHQGAINLKEQYAKDNNNIEFYCKSFLNHNLSDATVIYMDNTVYPKNICESIYKLLPKGCLVLYKKPFDSKFLPGDKQNKIKGLVKRTYDQNDLYWAIKE